MLCAGGEREVDFRWDAEDIGAVEVQIGNVWCEVAAVHAGLKGQARAGLDRGAAGTAGGVARERMWREETINRAIAAISEMNTELSLQFGLIDKPYSAKRIEELEAGLIDGFMVSRSPRIRRWRPAGAGGRGRSITPCHSEAEGEASARREMPGADGGWTFEE